MRESMYEVISQLIETREKKIYLVRHVLSHVFYIKKVFPPQADISIYEELAKNPHSGMANIVEYENNENAFVLIEEFINGTTLEFEMSARKFSLSEIQQMFMELFEVLDHIHNLKPPIIHRDIKPANIMLEKGHIRVIDFEIARTFMSHKNRDTQILGSVGFAAPEQFGFSQSDQRTDIFALGKLLAELLQNSPELSTYQKVIDRCSEIDPSKRYQTIWQLQREFIKLSSMKLDNRHRYTSIDIPGFRNEPYWQRALIYVFYIFCFLSSLTMEPTKSTTAFTMFISRVALGLFLLLMLWVPANVGHILEIFPLYNSKYKIVRILNAFLVWMISVTVIILALGFMGAIIDQLI